MVGKCPRCWWNKFSNQRADMITIGTKLKNSTTFGDSFTFRRIQKGRILESQVTKPQPTTVKSTKLKETMF